MNEVEFWAQVRVVLATIQTVVDEGETEVEDKAHSSLRQSDKHARTYVHPPHDIRTMSQPPLPGMPR